MKFNIDGLFNKPSFNFLLHQGFLVFLLTFTNMLSIAVLFYKNESDIITSLLGSCISSIVLTFMQLPAVIFFSLFTYFGRNIFLLHLTFLIFAVGLSSFITFKLTSAFFSNGGGDFIIYYLILTTPFIPIVAILFTLIPYLILRYREKKYNLVVKNPPYTKNKFLLIFSILGLCIYATLVVASIKLIFYFLNGY